MRFIQTILVVFSGVLSLAALPVRSDTSSTLAQIKAFSQTRGQRTTPSSINSFSDVQSTDWAYQALKSLAERYGCIVGYQDGSFRGNRALSRFEFAAGLNACLDKVTESVAAQEDLEALKRLMDEFQVELASLRRRVDRLEAQTNQLDAQQFSTTTKLSGGVWPILGSVFTSGMKPVVLPFQNFSNLPSPSSPSIPIPAETVPQAAIAAAASAASGGPFAATGSSSTFAPGANANNRFTGPPSINTITTATTTAGQSYDLQSPLGRAQLRFDQAAAASQIGLQNYNTFVDTLRNSIQPPPTTDPQARQAIREQAYGTFDENRFTTFDQVSLLTLNTSFTGSDSLTTIIGYANVLPFSERAGFPGAGLYTEIGDTNNNVELYRMYYSFPVGKATFMVGAYNTHVVDLFTNMGTFYYPSNVSFTEYFQFPTPGTMDDDGNNLFGFNWQPNDNWTLSAAYVSFDGNDLNQNGDGGDGVFGNNFSATTQISYTTSNKNLQIALAYAYRSFSDAYVASGEGYGVNYGTSRALTPFSPGVGVNTNNVSLNAAYKFSPKVNLSLSYGYSWAKPASGQVINNVEMVSPEDRASIQTWAVMLGFPDLFAKGNAGGLAVAQIPYVSNNTSGWGTDASGVALEGWYQFQITDAIALLMGVTAFSNTDGISGNPWTWRPIIQTQFIF